MSKDSKIEWTDHTLNFWWGCVKVSPGCEHCYAETLSKRYGRDIWGPAKTTERYRTKGPWKDVRRWEKEAAADGIRRRVFCQSMSDFFEDHPQLTDWRIEACEILESLRWLDVQLLTKRPENILRMVPSSWLERWPAHIWIGTSVENQEQADKRIPHLLAVPAAIRFLSIEPMLGPVDLTCVSDGNAIVDPTGYNYLNVLQGFSFESDGEYSGRTPRVSWVIVGGESGHGARPMHPEWARSIRDQCRAAGTPYFFKQWGEYTPYYEAVNEREKRIELRQLPLGPNGEARFRRVGKKAAGRLLDGREWNEMPQTPAE